MPSGTVEITAAEAPDAVLDGIDQDVYLGNTKLMAMPGKTTSFAVTVDELYNADETVVATAAVSPTSLNVNYTGVSNYSTLDVSIGQLSPPIDKNCLMSS